jgi:hypothetical protein
VSSAAPPDGVRAARVGDGCDGGRAGVTGGAIVSCDALNSFESRVASGFTPPAAADSSGSPQDEQNLLLEETCAPQTEQNIEPKFYHCAKGSCDQAGTRT